MSREHDCILAIYMPFVVTHASFGLQDITSKEEIRKAAEWLTDSTDSSDMQYYMQAQCC
jgi:hypothetical protein